MTAFSPDAPTEQQLDWAILRDGGVALYWRSEILDDDLNWLDRSGYRIISLDAADWNSEVQMHECLQTKLSFPSYYGRNLDALDECICDDLPVPETGGLVLVLKGYDRFVGVLQRDDTERGNVAEMVLDILARAVRYHMLFGRRLLILVQSQDPKVQFGRLGGHVPVWNRREWLNKNRRL